jgi:sulfate permease, SulP family
MLSLAGGRPDGQVGAVRLAMLRGYQRPWLRGDLIAGVTVAAYLIPQVMAYATAAGLNPVTGLWAALPALVAYAIFGSSRSLSMEPEATTALMTAIAIRPLAAGQPARYAALAVSLALLVGLMGLGAWALRLGFVSDLLSRPVLVGYMAGVALIMIADQLGRVTAVPVTGQAFFAQLGSFGHGIGSVQPATAAVAAAVLIFLLLLGSRWPHAPGPLLAVLLATAAVAALGLGHHGVSTVGPVPAALPKPALPNIHPSVLRELLLPAFTVLIVGFSDGVLTARSFKRPDESVLANRELLALGVANAGSSVLHGFPVSSSATRTAIARATVRGHPADRPCRVPSAARVPPRRTRDRGRDLHRRSGLQHPLRRPGGDRAVRRRLASQGGPAARRDFGPGPRPGGHA